MSILGREKRVKAQAYHAYIGDGGGWGGGVCNHRKYAYVILEHSLAWRFFNNNNIVAIFILYNTGGCPPLSVCVSQILHPTCSAYIS